MKFYLDKQFIFLIAITAFFFGCKQKQKVDSLYFNARVYTVDSSNSTPTAFVVSKGKFISVGSEKQLRDEFDPAQEIDLHWQFVYPGLNDAHAHFYGLGQTLQTVDLIGTTSWQDVLDRCSVFYKNHPGSYILGRGWDQNDWTQKEYPVNDELNKLFPNIPVLLKRVDGHAAIANDYLLKKTFSYINLLAAKIDGGEVIFKNKIPTGVLIDNAVDLVKKYMPEISTAEKMKSLLDAQKVCFENGLTTVCDAGLDKEMIDLIDSLQKAGVLKIRIYAMVNATEKNIEYYLSKPVYKSDLLNVCSFKLYADGALGSRGACLLKPYNDSKDHSGFLLTSKEQLEEYVKKISKSKFQLNTHCIGDSANRLILNLYAKYLKGKNDQRWRIEHAQVIDSADFKIYGAYNIIPSVQPTHATSDMYWAGDRLGKERLKYAYAYKLLLQQNSWMPLGTDFPVESVNPFYTFYSAVARQDSKGFPPNGFQPENALTREEALRGITIWPAMAAFEEKEKGSIEAGKFADFILLDTDLLKDDLLKIRNAKVNATFVGGVKVN
jgi:predicted amidohydrolase YtcJ